MDVDWRIQTNGGFFELIEIAEKQNFVLLDPQKIATRGSEAACARVNVLALKMAGVAVRISKWKLVRAANDSVESVAFTCGNKL
jgi:hypothetical protein